MNKYEFLAEIRKRLGGLSKEDIDRSLDYYREMVEDRMEDGLTEEEAVAALGPIEDIVAQIFADSAPVEYKAGGEERSQKSDTVPPKNEPKASNSERKTKKTLSIIGLIAWICVSIAFWCWAVGCIFAASVCAITSVGCAIGSIVLICMGEVAQFLLFLGGASFLTGFTTIFWFGIRMAIKYFRILGQKLMPIIQKNL